MEKAIEIIENKIKEFEFYNFDGFKPRIWALKDVLKELKSAQKATNV